ncbi:MAG: RNA polymerase sigma-54 factor [Dehalococcoidia bacterium]|nr:RNA polymerase sigma-54 factor [Bacillota bacterium]MBT9141621.1 RNA polymerase sigma-54 factor [Bacillota bacterium]
MRISYNLKLEQSQKLMMTPKLQQAINLLLSDRKLVELLARRDVLLSRRTVAKYREEMGIPSSTRRKRI